MAERKITPLELSEIFHVGMAGGGGSEIPQGLIENKEHIKEFFDTKNIRLKTRLKRKDVSLLTIIETKVFYYERKYGIQLNVLTTMCRHFRENLVSEGGKSRQEFVESIKDRPEYPLMGESGNPSSSPLDTITSALER